MTPPVILRMPPDTEAEWMEVIDAEIERLEQAADGLCCMMFGRVRFIDPLPVPEYAAACDPIEMMEGG